MTNKTELMIKAFLKEKYNIKDREPDWMDVITYMNEKEQKIQHLERKIELLQKMNKDGLRWEEILKEDYRCWSLTEPQ